MNLDDRTAWVFDLDGTLTVPVHDFDAIRAELGLPDGRPILEELARLPAGEAASLRVRLDEMERELALTAQPAPGAAALIGALLSRGVHLGILTRNTKSNARLTLEAIDLSHAFPDPDIVGRDEAPPKPDPAGLRHLLRRWAVPAARAVVVGDYRFDLEVGRAAGVRTAHVDPDGAFLWPGLTDVCATALDQLL